MPLPSNSSHRRSHTAATAMHEQIFQVFQAGQMLFQHRVAPRPPGSHITAAKTKIARHQLQPLAFAAHGFIHEHQEAACPPSAAHRGSGPAPRTKAVGHPDIILRHLDVGDIPAAMVASGFHGALKLMQQRDGVDERQVLGVIAAGPCEAVGEREIAGERIHYGERLQQALGILMHFQNVVALLRCQQAFQRMRLALQPVSPASARGPRSPPAPCSG